MLELLAVFAIVLVALVVYYETRISRINARNASDVDLLWQWYDHAMELQSKLDRIYADYGDLKLHYGHAVTAEKIANGKIKARTVEKTKVHAIALPGFALPNGDHELKFDNEGHLVFERKPKTENKAQSNGDKSKSENGNKNTPKTEAKSESFEHKDYQTVVNQLGGTVSEIESKSIKSQLDKNNDVKVIVGNIKKWRENNAKKVANSK